MLSSLIANNEGATIFAYHVGNPKEFGIVEIDEEGNALSITEKPNFPKSKLAVTGLYIFNNDVIKIASNLEPSQRGELEITDVNNTYLRNNNLKVKVLGRGFTWLDAGTHDALLEAGKFVQIFEQRQGLKIACLEEIGYLNGWISGEDIKQRGCILNKTNYGQYLLSLLEKHS
jgi:glucose-1-phosphate thymidylyltransferase